MLFRSLLSVGNVPDLEMAGVRYVGMRADLSGTVETIYNAVLAIETARAVFISEASVWQSGGGQTKGEIIRAPEISAQVHVYGALNPDLRKLAGAAQ